MTKPLLFLILTKCFLCLNHRNVKFQHKKNVKQPSAYLSISNINCWGITWKVFYQSVLYIKQFCDCNFCVHPHKSLLDDTFIGFGLRFKHRTIELRYQIFIYYTHLRNYKGHCSLQSLGARLSWKPWVISAAIHPTTTPRIICVVWSIVSLALSSLTECETQQVRHHVSYSDCKWVCFSHAFEPLWQR